MRDYEFKYQIGDEVTINALNVLAMVDGLMHDVNGNSYRVIYWNDGMRNNIWVYEWELSL